MSRRRAVSGAAMLGRPGIGVRRVGDLLAGVRVRVLYAFDRSLARPFALLGWLALLSAGLVFVITLVVWLFRLAPDGLGPGSPGASPTREPPSGFFAILWNVFLRTLDAGTMAQDKGWGFAVPMMAATLIGVFVISVFISMVTSLIQVRLEALRRGRSPIIERDHTVILGWSPLLVPLISALQSDRGTGSRRAIAVLALRAKTEMEDAIRTRLGERATRQVVCRTGEPQDRSDLAIARPSAAASVIVVEPDGSERPQQWVLGALRTLARERHQTFSGPERIVAMLRESEDLEEGSAAGHNRAVVVATNEAIAQVIARTSRVPGWSAVFERLLGADGSALRVWEPRHPPGTTLGEVLLAFDDVTVVGCWDAAGFRLPPSMDDPLGATDSLVALASGARFGQHVRWNKDRWHRRNIHVDLTAIRTPRSSVPTVRAERTLLVGWNRRARAVVRALDEFVALGSEATVLRADDHLSPWTDPPLRNLTLRWQEGDPTDGERLARLDLFSYDQVVVLPNPDAADARGQDGRTVATIAALQEVVGVDLGGPRIVAEMFDARGKELVESPGSTEVVVGQRLTGLLLARLARDARLAAVFEVLLRPGGIELALEPIEGYVSLRSPVSFATIVAAACGRGQVAIGDFCARSPTGRTEAEELRLNPIKARTLSYAGDDRVVLIVPS